MGLANGNLIVSQEIAKKLTNNNTTTPTTYSVAAPFSPVVKNDTLKTTYSVAAPFSPIVDNQTLYNTSANDTLKALASRPQYVGDTVSEQRFNNSVTGNTGDGTMGGSTKTSGGSGSGSSSSTSSGNGAYATYMQLAAAQMAAQQARADQAAAAQRAAAQNAYDRGMSALSAAYNTRLNMLGDNYNNTLDQLNNSLNYSSGNVNKDADASLKQAYINRMMNEKNLNQQLTSQGLSGGAAESTLAKLYNNYGNSRNNIETTRADNLNELYNTYNNNVSSALQAYNTARANADAERLQYVMNLENALANNQIATEQSYQNALTSNNDSYLSALADAVDMMNRYNYTPSAATNDVNLATVIQNAVNGGVYNKNADTGAVEQAVTAQELEQLNNNNYLNALLKSFYGVQ